MRYQEQREAFKKLAIQQGIYKLEQLGQALPFGYTIPQEFVDRWLRRMLELPSNFSTQRRYVNRFKLGADPEFVCTHGGARVDARMLGLQQGQAYGMDNNGRLIELRPYPHRSAVNVVASVLAAMRWMCLLNPETNQYNWEAGAFLHGDGLGGHVHFGRKRPGRDIEVKALDAIDDELLAVKAYPLAEVMRRREGDQHNQHYGLPGDIRKQLHGYEYRTFPSWLDSPELAFLTITLSKLAVLNPGLVQGYVPITIDRHIQRIKNLLSYYKDVDDDARLALLMVSRQFPVHIGGDFRRRWGLEYAAIQPKRNISFLPSCIKPGPEDLKEMFEHLSKGTALLARVPIPTWSPLAPPEGYHMAINDVNTHGAKGLGELLWDVCTHKDTYKLINNRDLGKKIYFSISRKLSGMLPPDWGKFCGGHVAVHNGDEGYIYSSEKAREVVTFVDCKRILLETVFPFWRIYEVKQDSYQQWQSTLKKKVKPRRRFAGELLYGDERQLPALNLR